MSNRIDPQYKELLEQILHFGVNKADRTGTGTKSIFGWQIRHNMKEGFPLLTTKKMAWKSIVTELLWFLRGDTNIQWLVQNDCHIWDGDAYKNYLQEMSQKHPNLMTKEEFIEQIKTNNDIAEKWGQLGPIYGAQWRDWGGRDEVKLTNEKDENGYLKFKKEHIDGVDQIKQLIEELKINPDSRRLMVNAWNVSQLDKMVLPPCHYGFQCYVREGKYLSLMWNQRSVDTFLGLPFNIASYALLLEIIAKAVNMIPDELIGNLGDTHLYNNHIDQAKEQIQRVPYELPKLKFEYGFENILWFLQNPKKDQDGNKESNYQEFFKQLQPNWFTIEDYQSHPAIKAPLSN